MSSIMKQLIIITLCIAAIPALSTSAFAQAEVSGELNLTPDTTTSEPEPVTDEGASEHDVSYERGGLANTGLTVGLKLGAGFSQPFGDLGTGFLTELEVGYVLPVAKRALAVFVSGGYTQPGAEGKNLVDERLPGPASYELTQQQLLVTLGLTYRLHLDNKLVRPYASLGPRLFMMRTQTTGSAGGMPFGDNEETATTIGLFGALGAELYIGPGAALIELSMTWARINGYVLRDTSASALGIGVGYRLFL
jgi:Outer membrane protein beta-barrel domain